MLALVSTSQAFVSAPAIHSSKVDAKIYAATWDYTPGVKGLTPDEEAAYPTAKLVEMGGWGPETGNSIWDPLRLASADMGASGTDAKLDWYRNAELKHGRISMAACLGYFASKTGTHFSAYISKDGVGGGVSFEDLVASNPFAEWAGVPFEGKIQLFTLAAGIELAMENNMINGGKIGEVPFIKNRFPSADANRQLVELKNGRLAMVGIASFYAAEQIPGSVPLLNNFWG